LTVEDVPHKVPLEESPTKRFTMQHFDHFGREPSLYSSALHNLDARQPEDDNLNQWPSALILDFFYGCAALNAWGVVPFAQFVRESTKDVYYDAKPDDERRTRQVAERNARLEARTRRRLASHPEESQISDVMDIVMALWMRPYRASSPRQRQTMHSSDVNGSRDKVQAWLDSSEGADSAVHQHD
jgi:hypothetical protein